MMAMTFDATLKELGRESPHGFLAAFDRPPMLPVNVLNVDLSTVTLASDLVLGLGEPLEEIIHLEFQSSAAAWKHADLMAYNAILYARHHVPVRILSCCCCDRRRGTRIWMARSATIRGRDVVRWNSATRSSAYGKGRPKIS